MEHPYKRNGLVFVSYARTGLDGSYAQAVASGIRKAGHSVFIDTSIEAGKQWERELLARLEEAEFFVVLLSNESIYREFVKTEVKHVVNRVDRGEDVRVLPVRLDYFGSLGLLLESKLSRFQHLTWSSDKPIESLVASILEVITSPAEPASLESTSVSGQSSVLDDRPFPTAEPELETGAMSPESHYYIHRPADAIAMAELMRNGATTVIKGPRQAGKSSLLARLHFAAIAAGRMSLCLDFQLVDQRHFADIDALFRHIARRILRACGRKGVSLTWDPDGGAKDNLTDFIEDCVLEDDKGFQLILDEADVLFDFNYRDEFFATVRGWHNLRANSPRWKQFSVVIGHSTSPALWIRNINQSPFNVGCRIALSDFDKAQIASLNNLYGSPVSNGSISDLHQFIGGHPYLVRVTLYSLAVRSTTLQNLSESKELIDEVFGDHLRTILWSLRNDIELISAINQIMKHRRCESEEAFQRLGAAGLIRGQQRMSVELRCKLYQKYLAEHL